ncbi:MAG: GspH/FimT family pseudopilin [Tepidimonas sp.]|uniref:GspH/FimT family pseudopilin n=1 Tax=Tepidimonas sp. TaxID=2002775 RepID=UPI00298F2E46|nr:GspH/FimT family pseudopilin [Tepidimonas sp.]MDW8336141.1 GspH/FimT family pseudopilin [Tepidimonas sp.]
MNHPDRSHFHVKPVRGRCRHGGVTVIELIVVVAILAVLATVAVPSFRTQMQRSRVEQATVQIQGTLQAARMEAIRRNRSVSVCTNAATARVQAYETSNPSVIIRDTTWSNAVTLGTAGLSSTSGGWECARFDSTGLAPLAATSSSSRYWRLAAGSEVACLYLDAGGLSRILRQTTC